LTKKEDPTRLSTMANVMFVSDTDEYNFITDIIGYNKYYGWYTGVPEDFSEWIDGFHQTNPNVPLCISEYGAEGIVQYHSNTPKVRDYTEEYHALYHEKVWKKPEQRPFLWATYVWNMFVALHVNGKEFQSKNGDERIVCFDNVPLKDALNELKVIGTDNGVIVEDTAWLNKVTEPNQSYEAPDEGQGESAENWFEMPDLSDVEIGELEISDDVFSTRCTLRDILNNDEAKAVFRTYFGKIDKHPMFSMTLGLTLDQMQSMNKDRYDEKLM
jgi:hypothetical protein